METRTPLSDSEERANKVVMSPAMAEHVAAVTCELVLDYFKRPGVEEKFQAWLAERQKRKEG